MLFVLSELIIITLRTWLNTHFYNEYSTVLRHIHLPFYRDIEFWNWMDLIFLESYQSPSGIWTCSRPPPWVHFSQTVSDVTPPCLSNCHVLEGNVIIVYFWQCIYLYCYCCCWHRFSITAELVCYLGISDQSIFRVPYVPYFQE